MAAEPQRRFRKRGGAKKKKKAAQENVPSDVPREEPSLQLAFQGEDGTQYMSGFTSEPSRRFSSFASEGYLDADLKNYLQKLQENLEEVDPEAKEALAYSPVNDEEPPASVLLSRNALTELCPRIHEIARNNNAARLVEILISTAHDAEVLSKLLSSLFAAGSSRLAQLATHHCAGHVLEKLLKAMKQEAIEPVGLAEIVSAWKSSELMDMISESSGSHVFRTIVATLAGLPEDEPREAKLDDTQDGRITTYLDSALEVSEDNGQAICAVANTLLESDKLLSDLAWQPATSAALQGLLSAVTLFDRSLAKRIAGDVLKVGISALIYDRCGCRFVERAILCLGGSIVSKDMKGQLAELARHPKGNFAVQRYLLGLTGRGAVMNAWDELEDSIPNMIGFGKAREGVVLSLLRISEVQGDENCRRRASRCVAKACGAVGGKAKVLAGVMVMGSEEMWERWRKLVEEVNYTGCGIYGRPGDVFRVPGRIPRAGLLGTLIARCLMRFPGGPGQACRDSMAALSNLEVVALAGEASGSRLVEQWIQDKDIERGAKVAAKVYKALKGDDGDTSILAVARNPYGGKVIITCISLLSGQHRKELMDTLASDYEELRKNEYGEIVLRKCRVQMYMRRTNEWENEESTKETKQRLFANILQDDEEDTEAADLERKERKKKRKEKKRKRKEAKGEAETENIEGQNGVSEEHEEKNGENLSKGGDEGGDDLMKSVLGAIEAVAKPAKKKRKKKKSKTVEE